MDRANHTDKTKWLLPAYVADKPHQPKYSQVSMDLWIHSSYKKPTYKYSTLPQGSVDWGVILYLYLLSRKGGVGGGGAHLIWCQR
jgi:hypothetical protein